MTKNNSLESEDGQRTGTEQNTVKLQIAAAKERQRKNARLRATQRLGGKSPAAVTSTTPQSELTSKPPILYEPPKINVPNSLWEVARLLEIELNKISASQSFLLTMWEKLRGQVAGQDSVQFNVPVDFDAGLTINGLSGFNPIPVNMPASVASFDDPLWGWCLMATNAAGHPGTWDGYGVCLTYSMQGTRGYATPLDYINALKGGSNCWVIQEATDTHATKWIRAWTNAGPWTDWQKTTTTPDPIST